MGKMGKNEYDIQELLQRDVYVNDKKVGTIVGERHHPNESRVQSMRIMVLPDVAEDYMRKPAELAPLHKDLIHSIRNDGSVKLSKSIRELQRRWRNTVRIDEKLYAPDEMMDRAVLDNQGMEIGTIQELVKVKRTYRAVVVKTRIGVQMQYGIEPTINIPITALARTRERLDEVVLSRTFDKLLTLPSYLQANDPDVGRRFESCLAHSLHSIF
jgi:sporulation protein YlmC with PRC-barrel domain